MAFSRRNKKCRRCPGRFQNSVQQALRSSGHSATHHGIPLMECSAIEIDFMFQFLVQLLESKTAHGVSENAAGTLKHPCKHRRKVVRLVGGQKRHAHRGPTTG